MDFTVSCLSGTRSCLAAFLWRPQYAVHKWRGLLVLRSLWVYRAFAH
jgi:hypothetical protein